MSKTNSDKKEIFRLAGILKKEDSFVKEIKKIVEDRINIRFKDLRW